MILYGMSYKDPQKQKDAQRRSYLRNKEVIAARKKDKRNLMRRHIQEVKSSTPCTDCKKQYPYYVMGFDHLRDKKFNVSNTHLASSMEDLINEISKCEVVCSNCHKVRTYTRKVTSGDSVME